MAKASQILDEYGRPFVHANGKPRPEMQLAPAQAKSSRRSKLDARYEAAQDTAWLTNHWAAADSLDADSANSRAVREKMVPRARHETGNNGFMAGMLASYCDFLVGNGPTLRMQSGNDGFDKAVELLFTRWAKSIQLRRKLWCMTHAKVQDGEAFGILGENTRRTSTMQLDVKLIETEQCQSPYMAYMQEDYIDGIRLHPSGDAQWYEILRTHPGSSNVGFGGTLDSKLVPAEEVLHWFRLERPGQHRALPEFRSTLNTGAASRRFREATIQAAESVADLNVIFSSEAPADTSPVPVPAMSAVQLEKGMATAAPMGWNPHQIKSEHPSAAYEMFVRSQLIETARPKGIPYNVAAGDSAGYNFASGKLDHQAFFTALTGERLDCNDLVLDKIFLRFWLNALAVYGWGGSPFAPPDHDWDWPVHPVADVKGEASADDTRLRNGTLSLTRWYREHGMDFDDEVVVLARDYGVSVKEMRGILLRTYFSGAQPPAPPQPKITVPAGASDDEDEDENDGSQDDADETEADEDEA